MLSLQSSEGILPKYTISVSAGSINKTPLAHTRRAVEFWEELQSVLNLNI